MYAAIHKALRSYMMDTLFRTGRLDVGDAQEMAATLAQADELLAFCLGHLVHENDFVHTAIEARRPGGAARAADEHVEHVESIEALRAEVAALPLAPAAARPALALRLYHHLSLFVAENFEHMHFEETHNNAALWALYSDAELVAIHDRLLASIAPQEHLVVARWMLPAVSPAERAAIVGGMKQSAPPAAFQGVLAVVRPHLDDSAWLKLAAAVDL